MRQNYNYLLGLGLANMFLWLVLEILTGGSNDFTVYLSFLSTWSTLTAFTSIMWVLAIHFLKGYRFEPGLSIALYLVATFLTLLAGSTVVVAVSVGWNLMFPDGVHKVVPLLVSMVFIAIGYALLSEGAKHSKTPKDPAGFISWEFELLGGAASTILAVLIFLKHGPNF